MNLLRRTVVSMVLLVAGPAMAADYPERPVRIIVPYSVGTATEVVARNVADSLSKSWGQGVVVDAMPGAGGIIGTQALAKAQADGYTLGVVAGAHAAQPALGAVPYDPLKDFTPVMNLAFTPLVLVVNASSPYKTASDFIAAAKSKPRSLSFGSGGVGSSPHMAMEDFVARANIELTHVPYKSLSQLSTDLIAGRIDSSMQAVATFVSLVQAGQLRALGVTGPSRFPLLPDAPPLQEAVPGYVTRIWIGIIGPAGLPDAVVKKIYADASAILKTDDMKQRLLALGVEIDVQPSEPFWKQVAEDLARWEAVAKRAGISAR